MGIKQISEKEFESWWENVVKHGKLSAKDQIEIFAKQKGWIEKDPINEEVMDIKQISEKELLSQLPNFTVEQTESKLKILDIAKKHNWITKDPIEEAREYFSKIYNSSAISLDSFIRLKHLYEKAYAEKGE